MKNITLSLMLLTVVTWIFGQDTKTFKAGTASRVEVYLEQSELEVTSYNGSEIIIETDNYQAPPERAKGLKSLYNTGTDNTGIGLSLEKRNNSLILRKCSSRGINYRMKVPAKTNLKIVEKGWWGGRFMVTGVKGEIEINANNANIELQKVSGPIVANTTSGEILITMEEVNASKPSAISNVSGFIDITLPASTKASLEMKSISGEIYTDLDLEMVGQKQDMRRIGGADLKGNLNGGGVDISLNAISGNIYLRKK